jgi:hypothetical protein
MRALIEAILSPQDHLGGRPSVRRKTAKKGPE